MSSIELPRALTDYFAHAETDPTRRGRRFSITLSYYIGERIDRIQWWYHVSQSEELMFDGHGLAVLKERAIGRFCVHIERWLNITHQRLHGEEPIPRVSPRQDTAVIDCPRKKDDVVVPWPIEKIAHG